MTLLDWMQNLSITSKLVVGEEKVKLMIGSVLSVLLEMTLLEKNFKSKTNELTFLNVIGE